MTYLKTQNEDLLTKILRDPEAAVAAQLLIPPNLTCAIISRRMRGIFNRQDQIQLASETVRAIQYIAEHDFFAFLVFLDRFDLIRKLFWQKELFPQHWVLIDRLEKEKEDTKKQEFILNEQERLSILIKQQQKQLIQEREKQLQKEKVLINIELYQYLIHLEQDIHIKFHIKQIEILDNVFKGRMERIDRAILFAFNDPTIAIEDRDALSKLQKEYKEEYEAVQRMIVYKLDATIDPIALINKSEAALRVTNKFKPQIINVLLKYPECEQWAQIAREESNVIKVYEGQLTQNLATRDKQLLEIRPHLGDIRQIAKDEIVKSIKTSITYLTECKVEELNDGLQINSFENTIKKLTAYRDEISQTHDDARVQELTNQLTADLVRIKSMIKPSMLNPVTFQKFENEVRVLSELNTRLNTEPAALNMHQIPASKLPPYAQQVQYDAPPPYHQAIEMPPHSYREVQQIPLEDNVTFAYREQVFQDRTQHQEKEIAHRPENSTQSSPTEQNQEIDGELQGNIDKCISIKNKKFKEIRSDIGFSLEEEEMVSQVEAICTQISSLSIKEQANVSLIESAQEFITVLAENHSELEEVWAKFDSVIQGLSYSPKLGN